MSRLLIPDEPVHYLPKLARRLGLAESILAQQIYYFQTSGNSGHEQDGYRWIYNTYEQWAEKTGLTVKQVRSAISHLEQLGVMVSAQLSHNRFDHKKYYRIVEEHQLFDTSTCPVGLTDLPSRADPSATGGRSSYLSSENTTENNTENEGAPAGAPARGEQYLPLAAECRQVIEAGAAQLDVGGRLPEFQAEAAAQVLEQLIRLDKVPEEEILPALRWAYSGEPSFPWHLQLLSIAQWRKRGKGNNTPKFVSLWRQWRASLQCRPDASNGCHAPAYDVGRIME